MSSLSRRQRAARAKLPPATTTVIDPNSPVRETLGPDGRPVRRVVLSGLKQGALPLVYDPKWPTFTDLAPQQIAKYQSFEEDLIKYARAMRWRKEHSQDGKTAKITLPNGVEVAMDDVSRMRINGLKQAFDAGAVKKITFFAVNGPQPMDAKAFDKLYGWVIRYEQATFTMCAKLLDDITAEPPTVTSRAEIDAAYAQILVK